MANQKPGKTKGSAGDDVLTSGPDDDAIDGKAGFDTVIYSGSFLKYHITRDKHEVVVSDLRSGAPDGVDTLKKVEALQFTDRIIYLDGRNNAPHAVGDSAAGTEDTAIIIAAASLLANDGDFDGNAISLASVGGAINGTVALNGAGNVVFTPNADFNGTASFTYQAKDATLTSHPATVTVTIAAVNDAPTAVADTAAAAEDSAGSIINVLANDAAGPANESAQALTVLSATAQHGIVVINPNGTIAYTPNSDYTGPDTISYTIQDNGTTNGAADPQESSSSVAVTVTEVNDAPVAEDDTLDSVAEDGGPRAIAFATLVGNDSRGPSNESGQALTITQLTNAVGGTVAIVAGQIEFTPQANFNGSASFDYTVTDNGTTNGAADAKSDAGHVTFSVTEVNDAPVADDNMLSSVAEDSGTRAIAFETLTGNDSRGPGNESGQSLMITTVANAFGGIVAVVDGQIEFTPEANFNGTASFDYTVSDNGATNGAANPQSDVGHVSFSVTAVNDAPVANADTLAASEGTPNIYAPGQLLGNDTDVDSSPLSIESVTSGTGGTATLNTDGTVSFTPAANFNGPAAFSYAASDGTLTSNSATVTVNVAAVNHAPTVAVSPLQVTIEETENPQLITAAVLLSAIGASDIDGDALRIVNFRLFGPDGEVDPNRLPPGVALEFADDGSFALFSFDPRDFSHLTVGESEQIRLEFDVVDGQGGTVHDVAELTIVGVADVNRPAIIGEPPFRDVTEDSNVVAGNLSVSGVIDVTDPDPGQSSLSTIVVPAAGNKGILSLQPHGAYTYIVPNGSVQYLGVSDVKVDSFTISSVDGTTRQVQFTVHGVNDRVVIPHQPTNPSFEQIDSPVPFGGTLSLAGGSTLLSGWAVIGAGIDFVRNGYQQSRGSDGGAYIDLSGSTQSGFSYAGGVRQVVETIPGSRYFVQFDMSGNPDLESVETIRVTGGGDEQNYSFDTAGHDWTNLGWREEQFIFSASPSETNTQLSFASLTVDFMGPLLDNVRLTPIHRVVEAAGAPAAPTNPSFGGTIGFFDPDLSDDGDHNVGSTFVGDPFSQLGNLTAFVANDTTNGAGGIVRWDYSVDPGAIEFLAAGERRLEKFKLTIDDGHFGGDASQYVLVDLVGTNDDPTIGNGTFSAALVTPLGVPGVPFGITRGFGFSDVDVSDGHGATAMFNAVRSGAASPIGTLTAHIVADTVNGDGGLGRWDYTLDPQVANALTPGEIFTDAFDIVLSDSSGGTATAQVIVTIGDAMANMLMEPQAGALL